MAHSRPVLTQFRPNATDKQIPCWKKFLSTRGVNVKGLSKSLLVQRDRPFRWTIVHAIIAGNQQVECCAELFRVLRRKCLISLICAKDVEGDTPLHSAVRSNEDPAVIELLLKQIPSFRRYLLQARNKQDETALQIAFSMESWENVQVLLKWCIKESLLVELTGLGDGVKNTKTQLHKAFQRGHIQFLRLFFNVCKACELSDAQIMEGLLATSKKGRTPWFYLVHQTLAKAKEAVAILSEFNIDLNLLLTNKNVRTYMLHDAYRKNKMNLVTFLLEKGADPTVEDARGLKPDERKKDIVVATQSSAEAIPSHSAESHGQIDEQMQPRAQKKRRRRKKRKGHGESATQTEPPTGVVTPIPGSGYHCGTVSDALASGQSTTPRVRRRKPKRRKRGRKHQPEERKYQMLTNSCDTLRMVKKMKLIPCPNAKQPQCLLAGPPSAMMQPRSPNQQPSIQDRAHPFDVAVHLREDTDYKGFNAGFGPPP